MLQFLWLLVILLIVFIWIDIVFQISPRLRGPVKWKIIAVLAVLIPLFIRVFLYCQVFGNNLMSGVQIVESAGLFLGARDVTGGQWFRALPHLYNSSAEFYLIGFADRLRLINISTMPYVHFALGCLTIPATYLLGRRLFNRNAALIAALWMGISLWAGAGFITAYIILDPLFFTFGYVAFLGAMDRDDKLRYFLAGVLVGIGILFRFNPPLPLLVMFLVLRARKPPHKGRTFGWVLLGYSAAMLPLLYDIITINPLWPVMIFFVMTAKGVSGASALLAVHVRLFQAVLPLSFLALDLSLPFFLAGAWQLTAKKIRRRALSEGESFLAIWFVAVFLALVFAFSYTDTELGLPVRPPRYYVMLFPAPYLLAAMVVYNWEKTRRRLLSLYAFVSRYLTVYALAVVIACLFLFSFSRNFLEGALRADDPAYGVKIPEDSTVISNFPLSKLHSTLRSASVLVPWKEFREKYMDFGAPKGWRNSRSEYYQYPYQLYDDSITRGAGAFDYDFGQGIIHERLMFGAMPVADFKGLTDYGVEDGKPRPIILAVMSADGISKTGFMARIKNSYHATVAGIDYPEWFLKYNPASLELFHIDEKLGVKYYRALVPKVRFQHARFKFRSFPFEPEPGVIPVDLGNMDNGILGYGLAHNLSHFWRHGIDPESEFDGVFISQYNNEFRVRTDPGRYEIKLLVDVSSGGNPQLCSAAGCGPVSRPTRSVPPGYEDLSIRAAQHLKPFVIRQALKDEKWGRFYFQPFEIKMELNTGDQLVLGFNPGDGWILVSEISIRKIGD